MLLNPAASQAVRPTPGIPALTSRAGASLSFVFPTPPATSRQSPAAPRGLPELPVSVWCLAGANRESTCSPVQLALQPPAAPRMLPELPVSVWCHAGANRESACSSVQVALQPPAARHMLPELPVSAWIQ